MITRLDLIKLGYNKKQDLKHGKTVSEDFRFGESGERDYLVNLSEDGIVNIVFGTRIGGGSGEKKANIYDIKNLNDFIKWHNAYEM